MAEANDKIILAMGERLLEAQARLEILEVAFINLLAMQERATVEAFDVVFRETGEEHLMASEVEGQQRRQHLAAVRLGKRIEALLAKRGARGGGG